MTLHKKKINNRKINKIVTILITNSVEIHIDIKLVNECS